MRFNIIFLIASFVPLQNLYCDSYTMKDLSVLAQDGEAREFLAHAKNIRPSERLSEWKELTIQMSSQLLTELSKKRPISRPDFLQVEELFSWPVLSAEPSFLGLRDKFGFSYLTECYSAAGAKDHCLKDLNLFWNHTTSEFSRSELAIKLAQIVQVEHPGTDLGDFFQGVLTTSSGKFICSHKLVQNYLEDRLEKITSLFQNWGAIFTKLDQSAQKDCWKKITPSVGLNTFVLKKYLGTLSSSELDSYHLAYLLESPYPGELFNESWNILRTLGKNNHRREEALKALKKLDPLPDNIISNETDAKKGEVIAAEFAQHFPEYFDFYLRRCLSFYRGDESFPDGNPTPNCRSVIKQRSRYLNTSLVNEIQTVLK